MTVIIEHIRRKGSLCYLAVAGGDNDVIVLASVIEQFGLKEGAGLTLDQLEQVVAVSDRKRAENYATYLLSRRNYSVGQMIRKLKQKGYGEPILKHVIGDFLAMGILDDLRFARLMVESMLMHKPAGRRYLIGRLRSSLVPHKIAESVVDEYLAETDETALAERLIRARWRYLSKFDLETARRKAYNYLSRRAIGYEAAKQAFDRIAEEEAGH
ncbi:MAG: regulatory protein RecX [candidate division Zixibacteria bacterium]|nr:regulatory protein RecX [candidate division Zixibacteria bacterium]